MEMPFSLFYQPCISWMTKEDIAHFGFTMAKNIATRGRSWPIEDRVFKIPTDFTPLYDWATCGGDVNVRDSEYGSTLLHIALRAGHVELTEWLLGFKALDVNAVNDEGYTPLEAAVHLMQLGITTDAWLLVVNDARFKPTGREIALASRCSRRTTVAQEFVQKHIAS